MKQPSRRVGAIVTLHHGLGDVAMALPFLERLVAATPDSERIVLYVKGPTEKRFLEMFVWPSRMVIVPIAGWLGKMRALLFWLRGARVLYTVHANDGPALPLLALLSPSSVRVGRVTPFSNIGYSKIIPQGGGVHKTAEFLEFMSAVTGQRPDVITDLSVGRSWNPDIFRVESPGPWKGSGPRIAVAPGSGTLERHKRWPACSYAELIDSILVIYPNADVRIIGGPQESGLCNDIVARVRGGGEGRVGAWFPESPAELARGLKSAECLVTNCNGPSHVAALVGCPSVVLFGPTNPSRTGPVGPRVFPVRVGLKCSPCYRDRFLTGCGRPICMELIAVREVLGALRAALDGGKSRVPSDVVSLDSCNCSILPSS